MLPSVGCHELWASLQLYMEHPLLWFLTNTSALCCKKRDSWLSPLRDRHAAWAAGGWSQVCSWYSQWPQGSHCPTHHHPVPSPWQPGCSLLPTVCVSGAGGVTWICPKLIFPASPLPEPQQQSLGKGGDTRYPRVFLVKTSTWVRRGKSKTVWHARQINFYALPAVTSPSRHGGCFLWRV